MFAALHKRGDYFYAEHFLSFFFFKSLQLHQPIPSLVSLESNFPIIFPPFILSLNSLPFLCPYSDSVPVVPPGKGPKGILEARWYLAILANPMRHHGHLVAAQDSAQGLS